jgi:hypothetical protein
MVNWIVWTKLIHPQLKLLLNKFVVAQQLAGCVGHRILQLVVVHFNIRIDFQPDALRNSAWHIFSRKIFAMHR